MTDRTSTLIIIAVPDIVVTSLQRTALRTHHPGQVESR